MATNARKNVQTSLEGKTLVIKIELEDVDTYFTEKSEVFATTGPAIVVPEDPTKRLVLTLYQPLKKGTK